MTQKIKISFGWLIISSIYLVLSIVANQVLIEEGIYSLLPLSYIAIILWSVLIFASISIEKKDVK